MRPRSTRREAARSATTASSRSTVRASKSWTRNGGSAISSCIRPRSRAGRCTPARRPSRASIPRGAPRPSGATRRRTSSTRRCAKRWASSRARRDRWSSRDGSVSTSHTPSAFRGRCSTRSRRPSTAGCCGPTLCARTRRRWPRRAHAVPSCCSRRSTATSCASSRSGTIRSSCAGERTSHERATSAWSRS